MEIDDGKPCPCGTGRTYGTCCGVFHRGERFATTAEELMRSRYTAFVGENSEYLRRTWHPETCPTDIRFEKNRRWTGLIITSTERGGMLDDGGTVNFVASFNRGDQTGSTRENSKFTRVDGKWVYVDG